MTDYVTPYLPESAMAAARSWKAQGKLVRVWAYEKPPLPESLIPCGNCQGIGVVYLSFLGSGPSAAQVTTHKPSCYLEADGSQGIGAGWYLVEKTVGYQCPHCQGLNSRAHKARPKPAATQAAKGLGEQLRIRSDIE